MNQYLLLKKIDVQNANAISGLTYGFPAITNFLGFAHALSRKLGEQTTASLGGVLVVSHKNTVHARQPKGWGDYVFALTRNPLTKEGNTAPINEEGRMNLQVSLLIEVKGLVAGDRQATEQLVESVNTIAPTLRLAGGQVINIERTELSVAGEDYRVLRSLMPGSVLIDRSEYLAEHYQKLKNSNEEASLFDAWVDFAKFKYKAEALEDDPTKANWHYVKKPQGGYLVPIMAGFKAISPLYKPGEVEKVRDTNVPVCFAEAAYSIGEWLSPHRISHIEDAIWRYQYQHPWYMAKTKPLVETVLTPDFDEQPADL